MLKSSCFYRIKIPAEFHLTVLETEHIKALPPPRLLKPFLSQSTMSLNFFFKVNKMSLGKG